ncbi:unnamed protein product [Parnassius apollo]|uniref:(apollo) hypothetical protein n=1 Tax=Parnassius apollo TaxID=110799 RepID=A0A8S3WCT3_PARAO|nr:unnamed protein product [Parnassius apollo]
MTINSVIFCNPPGTLSVFFPQRILSGKTNIDEFIDKLLQSDKFDELANKIAEKAVDKIKNLQYFNLSNKKKAKDSLISRIFEEKNDSIEDDIVTSKPKGNMIALVTHEPSPFGNLSLKYKHFFKKKSYGSETEQKYSKEIKNKEKTVTNKSNNKKGMKKKKLRTVENKDNKDENMSSSSESQSLKRKSVGKNATKTKPERDKKINSDSTEGDEDNNNGSSRAVPSKSSHEVHYKSVRGNNSTSMPINASNDKNITESSEDTRKTDISRNETDDRASVKKTDVALNENNTQSKRTLRTGNSRIYVLESSSEYDGYREDIYDTLLL